MAFLKGSGILVLSNVALKAMNFFLLPLYTKFLSPEQLGISDSITNLTGFVFPILALGLDSAFSAFYFDKNDADRGKKVFGTLSYTFIFLGIFALFLGLFSGPVSRLLFSTEEYRWIVFMAFGSVAVNLWYLPYSLELRLKNRMFYFGLANVLASLSMILLNILFVAGLQMGERALVLSTLLAQVIHMVLLLIFVRVSPKKENFDGGLLRGMVRYGLPLIPMTALNWVLSLSDQYVLLHYFGKGTVGIYGLGLRFVTVLNVVISAVSMAYTTFAFQVKDSEKAKRQYYHVFQLESLFLMGISFTVTLFGQEIVNLMSSNPSYGQAAEPLRDLLFAQTIYAMSGIVGYGINFAKKSGYYLLAVSAGAAVNLVLNLILIPEYGIKAAAMTTLIGYLVVFILVYIFSERLYPCHYGLIRVGSMTVVLYGTCLALTDTPLWARLIAWTVAAVLAIVVFRDELRKLYFFFRKRKRR